MKLYILLIAVLLSLSCESQGDTLQQSQAPQPRVLELLASGFQFTEGPTWCEEGYLLFSDIFGNKIYKWSREDGVTTYLDPSENANGISYDGTQFWVCRHKTRDIARLTKDGTITSLIDSYNNCRLNSPNDIIVNRQGVIYFTDPDYGGQYKDRELEFEGLYWIKTEDNTARLIDDSMVKPNGLALSPDQSKLYVCESGTNTIYQFNINPNGFPENKSILYRITISGEVDGITCHKSGYIFVAVSSSGIVILSPEGKYEGIITIADGVKVRNICFGNDDGNTLYITAGTALYRICLQLE
ncbi:MAG: SMP-30/gluconolactonase/LRE family protein [Marinifilaceae bacterium]